MKINPKTGEFETAKGGTGVFATKKRGRWQYRSALGTLIASGMEPAEFVKRYWMREDFGQ